MKFCEANISDLNEVVSLLNRVTCDLLEKNINQWEYPWNEKVIEDDILKKRLITIKNRDKIIALFSIKELTSFFDELFNDIIRG